MVAWALLALVLSVFEASALRANLPLGLFWNQSPSMPLGLYRVVSGPVRPSDEVIFPLAVVPTFGLDLPFRYLLKRVVSSQGETVRIDRDGLWIGGKLVAKRARSFGVSFSGDVPPGEWLVIGENRLSFDSRYYGPVPAADMTRVEPIVTWPAAGM